MPPAAGNRPQSLPTIESEQSAILENVIRTDLLSLENLPGKGKGLIASQPISPGTCIISESPLFTTSQIQSSDVERELARIVKSLPRESQRSFLTLHNNTPGREPFTNIMRTNAYPLGPSSSDGGIFPWVARINHSCLANTQQAWNTKLQQETVYAVRRIEKGDEITIGYSIGGTSAERKQKLKEHFGFSCTCELCSLSGADAQKSDARQLKAAELDSQIGDPKRVKLTPEKALVDCRQLLNLYQENGIADTRIPRLYYDAFQICIMHSDQARGRVFAKRCAKARRLCEGPDSADAAEMEGFAVKPASHDSFGGTVKWKLGPEKVPSDFDDEAFEKWLWREG